MNETLEGVGETIEEQSREPVAFKVLRSRQAGGVLSSSLDRQASSTAKMGIAKQRLFLALVSLPVCLAAGQICPSRPTSQLIH